MQNIIGGIYNEALNLRPFQPSLGQPFDMSFNPGFRRTVQREHIIEILTTSLNA